MSWTEPPHECNCGLDGCEPDPTAQLMSGLSRLCQTITADMAQWRGLLAGIRHDAMRASVGTAWAGPSDVQSPESDQRAQPALPPPDRSLAGAFVERLKREDTSA